MKECRSSRRRGRALSGRGCGGSATGVFGPRNGSLSSIGAVLALVAVFSAPASAQVINEVLAENRTQTPRDVSDGFPDMLEIYNDTDATLTLGVASLAASHFLSCHPADQEAPVFPDFDDPDVEGAENFWPFPVSRSSIPSGGRLTVFCDNNEIEGTCELHASFTLSSDGSETVVLWSPEDEDGNRSIVDRVYLPPTDADVSFGRHPDGAGGANLPLEDYAEHFVFYPPGESTFGSCEVISGICLVQGANRFHCVGDPNPAPDPEWNLPPRVTRIAQSTNAPAAGEEVDFTVRVRDERLPTPENIDRVELIFRVKTAGSEAFGDPQSVEFEYNEALGVISRPDQPLDFFSHWTGSLPPQEAGSRVEFFFRVTDNGGLTATRPRRLCHLMEIYGEGVGPCDREFGGDGCIQEDEDVVVCTVDDQGRPVLIATGERFFDCNVRSSLLVGYEPRDEVAPLVINEVVAVQTDLLTDETEEECFVPNDGICVDGQSRCCPAEDLEGNPASPDCCRRDEDFIEIFNSSTSDISVEGLWLSDSPFDPQRWQFPEGSVIPAESYIIVWLDRDGGRCPSGRVDRPCFWECPDPNDRSMQMDPPEFHASFAIDADGDQIFLYDTEENDFGLIHGLDFGDPMSFCGFVESFDPEGNPRNDLLPDHSIALIPDGDRNGEFIIVTDPTPREPNSGEPCSVAFRRGDVTDDGGPDLSDGVRILNFLFLGGEVPACLDAADSDDSGTVELSDAVVIFGFLFLGADPPASPGPNDCGPDPSPDRLEDCVYTSNCS